MVVENEVSMIEVSGTEGRALRDIAFVGRQVHVTLARIILEGWSLHLI